MERWTHEYVKGWMIGLGLDNYLYFLQDEAFDGKQLLALTESELVETHKLEKKIAKKIIGKRNEILKLQDKEKRNSGRVPIAREHSRTKSLIRRASLSLSLWPLHEKKYKDEKVPHSDIIVKSRSSSKSEAPSPLTREESLEDLKLHFGSLEQLTRISVRNALCHNPVARDVCLMLDKLDYVDEWDLTDVLVWLDFVGFPMYRPNFMAANISGKQLLNLESNDLMRYLKICDARDARTLANHIRLLNVY